MRAVLALLLALAVVPSAAAVGGVSINVDAFASPVQPDGPAGRAAGSVGVDCAAVLGPTGSTTIRLDVDAAPDWATVALDPTSFTFSATQCQSGRWSGTFRASATVTRDAPAFRTEEIRIRATAEGRSGATEVATAPITPAFLGEIAAEPVVASRSGGPGDDLVFPIVVRNLGNGDTKVLVEIVETPRLWGVLPPAPFTLGSSADGGDFERTVEVHVYPPTPEGELNETVTVRVAVTGFSAVDASLEVPPVEVALTASAQGAGDKPAPAAGLLAALALAAAVAALRRRA